MLRRRKPKYLPLSRLRRHSEVVDNTGKQYLVHPATLQVSLNSPQLNRHKRCAFDAPLNHGIQEELSLTSIQIRPTQILATDMSKTPPTETQKGSNDSGSSQPFHARRNSASSMYANPDEDPDYQKDPVIGRDVNGGGSSGQTDGHSSRGHGDQSTRIGG